MLCCLIDDVPLEGAIWKKFSADAVLEDLIEAGAGEVDDTFRLRIDFDPWREGRLTLDSIFAAWVDNLNAPQIANGSGTRTPASIILEEKDILFFIHAHTKITTSAWRQGCEGVEFLKHLRLTRDLPLAVRSAHAVVYSVESLESILRRIPENLILCTRGVTFLRIPEMLSADVTTRYLLDRAKEHAMLASEDFRVGVRASYRPPDSAHAFANWWGIGRLIRGANSLHSTPMPIKAMPASVKAHSELLSSKEAVFLHVGDDQEAGAKSVEAWEKDRRRIKKLGQLIKKHVSTNDQQPLIVYVDDQLKGGWYEAVHFALSGRSGKYCTPSNWLFRFDGEFPPVDLGDAESSAGKILTLNPRLVVTDLRLKGEDESKNSFENSSGKRLIERLRAKAPALPILLMTASNRADSVQQALRMGVDAYWTKEGIGERSSGDAPERQATDLILLVERLLGDDYNLLRGMDQHLRKFARQWVSEVAPRPCTKIRQDSPIADNCYPWWKKHKWGKSTATGPILTETIIDSAEEILGPLRRCMEMYREYLRTFTMFQSAPESTEDFWLRSICVQVGRIVEMVHRFDSLDKRSDNASTIKSRSDWLGLVIYEVRNKAAHYSRDYLFTKPCIQLLLLTVLYWLSLCDPRCEALPDDALVRLVDPSGTETVATFEEKAAAFFARPLGDHTCTTRDAERLRNGHSR